mmetsp:Transcript_135354/g.420610  ORF Transcript_135354/g.420610 Transcript_135354/m.420610 type:complete len:160 (-) Transcript_135354:50-529(-)
MKVEICSFSHIKMPLAKGRRFVRVDGKSMQFLSAKTERAFFMKRNPRNLSWTVLYRRKHKKGQQEEVTRKRTRRTAKFQRAIEGTTLDKIMAQRNMKTEVREAQREQALRAAKEKAKAKSAQRKANKPAGAKGASSKGTQQKPAKIPNVKVKAQVGGKR